MTFRSLEGFADITQIVQSAQGKQISSVEIPTKYIESRQNRARAFEYNRVPVYREDVERTLKEARENVRGFATTIGQVLDFSIIIIAEWVQKYWLKAKAHFEELNLYHKDKNCINRISDAVEQLMIYTKQADTAYTLSACRHFNCFAYDFMNEGHSVGVQMQYNVMQESKDALQKFFYSWRNVVLAMRIVEVDAVTYALMVRDLSASAIELMKYTHDVLRKEADAVGLRTKRRNIPSLYTIYSLTKSMTDVYATRSTKHYESTLVDGALNAVERYITPVDMNERIDDYALRMMEDYARYVIAKLLLEYRQSGELSLASIDALCKVLDDGEIIALVKELKKMRIGLGETDPEELSKLVDNAKNAPTAGLLKILIVKGTKIN